MTPNPSLSIASPALYAHEPRTLLPLLRAHLPHTLVVLATVLASRSSASEPPPAGVDAGIALPPPLDAVYATFPPPAGGGDVSLATLAAMGVGEYSWLVAVALPHPSQQIRVHHALVAAPPAEQAAGLADAERVVAAALREMAALYPAQYVVGSTHELLEPGTRRVVGGSKHLTTFTYVAPGGGFGHTVVAPADDDAWKDELVLDHGWPEDAPIIFATNPYRQTDYYAQRAAYTTCFRPRPRRDGEYTPCVAWVMTHGDGSLGALWTQPAYRRRGLARVLLAAHLATEEQRGVPCFCYIEEGNAASMGLFASLGWTPLPWTSYWVY